MKTLEEMTKELDKLKKEKVDFDIKRNQAEANVQNKINLAKEAEDYHKILLEKNKNLEKEQLKGQEARIRELEQREANVKAREDAVTLQEQELRKERNFLTEEKNQMHSKLQDAYNTRKQAEDLIKKVKDFASTI